MTDPPLPDSSAPPSWAQELLTWLVPRSSEESIPGDLLEEYREAVRPSRGPWRANLWYLRQVGGFLCRLTWMFVVFNAAAVILRTIFDTFAPPGFAPHSYQLRSSASTYSAVGTFLLAGSYAGYPPAVNVGVNVPHVVAHVQDILRVHLLDELHLQVRCLRHHVLGDVIDFVLGCRKHCSPPPHRSAGGAARRNFAPLQQRLFAYKTNGRHRAGQFGVLFFSDAV